MVVVTGNAYKFQQIQDFFPESIQRDIDLPEIQSLDSEEIVTFKLNEAQKYLTNDILVDDTALHIEGLHGLPGPLVKWFLATVGRQGIADMAHQSGDVRAEAVATLGYRSAHGETIIVHGRQTGSIVAPRGQEQGWNPIFLPDGFDKTYGEMSLEEHYLCNMRVYALQQLDQYL